ncbi:MAG TPA: nuclear transport factor 2 family protein [Acidimicrobiales bacterium]|jgi:hypothetical protein
MARTEATSLSVEERLQRLEDQLAINQLMMTYGPCVDSGSADDTGRLWTADGEYDAGTQIMRGRDEIGAMVVGAQHQSFVHNGCAHLISPPLITVDGDAAVATCYSQLCLRDNDDEGIGGVWPGGGRPYRVQRITANRWDFERGDDGWKVTRRVNRPLDGTDQGHQMFREAVAARR